jgi:hypothetical protein
MHAPRVLHIFPDAARVEQALWTASSHAAFVDATGYWSFSQLIAACTARKPVAPLTARVLVAAAARELSHGPFGAWTQDIAFARGAHELLSHLESQCARPEQLQQTPRGELLAGLWRRYRARKAALGVLDAADLVPEATKRLRAGLPEALRGFRQVVFRAVHDFSPARLAFIDGLEEACRAAGVTLTLELPRADNPAIDALVNEASAELERRHQSSSTLELAGELAETPFAPLSRLLFGELPAQPFEGLSAFSAATVRDEARELARRVRATVDAGAAPEDIAIVFRDLEPEPLIEALEERGLSARARVSTPLAETPSGRLALGLPALVDDAFPADRVARYLRDPGRVFAEAGVRDDRLGADSERGAYAVRLAALVTRYEEGWPKGPAADVRALAERVAGLIARTSVIRAEDTLQSHLDHWLRACEALIGPEDLEALRALKRALADAAAVAGLTHERLTRRELGRWLDDAAGDFELLARTPRAGAVVLLEARGLAGRSFAHVFIGGLTDGRFPGRGSSSGVLSDDEKGALNLAAKAPLFRLNVGERGDRLPLRVAEDRLLFHFALTAATQTLTLSHSRVDGTGRAVGPSAFLKEVERAAAAFEVKRLPRFVAPTAEQVVSESEWRLRAMLDGARPDAAWARSALALADMETERLRFFSNADAATGAFSGKVTDHAYDAATVLSAHTLGQWGNCAFQGFLSDVIGLEPAEEQGEDVDPRSKGALAHRVLEELLPHFREPIGELEPAVRAALDSIVEEQERRSAVGHPLLWKLSRDRVVREIVELMESERARPFDGLKPEQAERAFTAVMPPAREGELPVQLRGKIDRVDAGEGRAGIVDYKSGRVEGLSDFTRSLLKQDWQLPLYAWALRSAGVKDVDAAWVSLRKGSQKLSLVAEDAGVTIDELLAVDAPTRERLEKDDLPNLANALHALTARIRAGDYGARPEDCERCRFRSVCRISGRKLHDEGR